MAEGQSRPPFPWLYPYEEDGPRLGSIVLRPVVPISIVGREAAPVVSALVDSGCEHVLAAPWVARAASVDPGSSSRELDLGLGGETVRVRFLDLTMRLHAPGIARDDVYVEWQTGRFPEPLAPDVAGAVGQVGFLDQFTATFSRMARHLAVEEPTVFDRRFGVPWAR